MSAVLVGEFADAVHSDSLDLLRGALLIARIEFPRLRPEPSIDAIDRLCDRARPLVTPFTNADLRNQLAALSRVIYDLERFRGNADHYDDFRNSLMNLVLERRLGIPITLAVVYLAVGRRLGLPLSGISFPGHFLLRASSERGGTDAILDPFDHGRELSEADCQLILARQLGHAGAFRPALLAACSDRDILVRMLNNLKRVYIANRNFPQAILATSLLVTLDPDSAADRRDRGLLASHLSAPAAALTDLEHYLRTAHAAPAERERLQEHVGALRRRLALLN